MLSIVLGEEELKQFSLNGLAGDLQDGGYLCRVWLVSRLAAVNGHAHEKGADIDQQPKN